MTFAEDSIEAFHRDLASENPTPGGGSAAAVAGASAAAVVEMVCRVTLADDDFEAVHDEMASGAEALGELRETLHTLADDDTAAFESVMAAYRRPSDDPERSDAIQSAMTTAAEVPLETAEACLSVIEYAEMAAAKGNQNAVTDAGTGALLAHASLKAALYNVDINLGSIDDGKVVAAMRERRDALESSAAESLERVETTVGDAL